MRDILLLLQPVGFLFVSFVIVYSLIEKLPGKTCWYTRGGIMILLGGGIIILGRVFAFLACNQTDIPSCGVAQNIVFGGIGIFFIIMGVVWLIKEKIVQKKKF